MSIPTLPVVTFMSNIVVAALKRQIQTCSDNVLNSFSFVVPIMSAYGGDTTSSEDEVRDDAAYGGGSSSEHVVERPARRRRVSKEA